MHYEYAIGESKEYVNKFKYSGQNVFSFSKENKTKHDTELSMYSPVKICNLQQTKGRGSWFKLLKLIQRSNRLQNFNLSLLNAYCIQTDFRNRNINGKRGDIFLSTLLDKLI